MDISPVARHSAWLALLLAASTAVPHAVDAATPGLQHVTGSVPRAAEPQAGRRITCTAVEIGASGDAIIDASVFVRPVVVQVDMREDGDGDVSLNRALLGSVPGIVEGESPIRTSGSEPQSGLLGGRITAHDDEVVAMFQSNARRASKAAAHVLSESSTRFLGFKSWVGRTADTVETGRAVYYDVYHRVIIDPRDEAPLAKIAVHRGASVLSRVRVGDASGARRELFFRFPPADRPFQVLGCFSRRSADVP